MVKRFSFIRSLAAFAFVAIIGLPAAHAATSADLSVSIATPVANILKGEMLTYKVTVLNNGPNTAASFTLSGSVPAGLTFVSAPAGCNLNGSIVTCLSGKLALGASRVFPIKFSTSSAACGAVITNTVSVSSSNDPNAGNNTSNTVSTTIACPDFSITKSGPANIAKGDILLYKITVVNNAPSVTNSFTVTDVVPSGLVFDSASTDCSLSGSTVTCSGNVVAGGYRNFLLKFSTASAACGAVINNIASVSASMDPNVSNDTSNTVSTTVVCPDFSITKSGPMTILQGDILSYKVKVTNTNSLVAGTFTMTDIVPVGLTFVSAPAGCSLVGSTVTCSGRNVAGTSRSFLLNFSTASASCGAVINNVASVSSSTDQNAGNDTSSTVSTTVTC